MLNGKIATLCLERHFACLEQKAYELWGCVETTAKLSDISNKFYALDFRDSSCMSAFWQ